MVQWKQRWIITVMILTCFGVFATGCKNQEKNVATRELTTVKEVALYEGADRKERLIAAAQKEGELMIYTSLVPEDFQMFIDSFEKKYKIKVSSYRNNSEELLQRAIQETKANHNEADLIDTSGVEMEAMARENLFQEVKSPYAKELIPEAVTVSPSHTWVAYRLNVIVQAYNTGKVKREELPKTWEDLLDPKWKGRLGIEAADGPWYGELTKQLGEQKVTQTFDAIVNKNGISVRKGHTLLADLVVSGEVPFALTVYSHRAQILKEQGAPIDWFSIGTPIASPNGIGLMKTAKHPNAAVLFYDFMLSEAQPLLLQRGFVPTHQSIKSAVTDTKVKILDVRNALDNKTKWDTNYANMLKGK